MLPWPVGSTGKLGAMANNLGIAPPKEDTPIGELRGLLNDTEYTAVPDKPGYGEYENFGDRELKAFIAQGSDNLLRAAGFAYMRLSAIAAAQAVDWKSDDQSVTLSKRADALAKIAQMWFDQADIKDKSDGGSYFGIVYPFGNPYECSGYTIEEIEELEGYGNTPFGIGMFGN